MNEEIIAIASKELEITKKQINAVLSLLEQGNTVPFIARYRKEATGGLDEDQIRNIDKYYQYQVSLLKRKEVVIKKKKKKGMLTDQLRADI
ncbi:Tex-like N-terminal domain-containing protein, partial [Mediterraneibacter gnavus]